MTRYDRRWIALSVALLSVCSSLLATDAIPNRPVSPRPRVAAKSTAAKSLAPILKPIQEPLRLKLLAGVDRSSLNDASVVDVLGQFADARGVHEDFLKQLAARNFGVYKSAR